MTPPSQPLQSSRSCSFSAYSVIRFNEDILPLCDLAKDPPGHAVRARLFVHTARYDRRGQLQTAGPQRLGIHDPSHEFTLRQKTNTFTRSWRGGVNARTNAQHPVLGCLCKKQGASHRIRTAAFKACTGSPK